jgi:hypothetical protein
MSTGVYVYSVPPELIRAAPGSKQKKLLTAGRPLKEFFETIDEIAEDFDDEEEEGPPPKCEEAFKQIINGRPCDANFAYVYGYAYEGLCRALGAEVKSSWAPIARSYEFFPKVDKALKALKIKLTVADLLGRGPLIAIPRPGDFPALGWWTADEMAEASRIFATLDLKKLDARRAKVVQPVADAVEDIREWITVASGRAGQWLVGVQC